MGRTSTLVERRSALTENERIVLEGLLAHKKSKQIARELDISFYAVEERIRSARQKLDAPDRPAMLRAYTALYADHLESVARFEGVESLEESTEELIRDLDDGPTFSLHDAQSFGAWSDFGRRRSILEILDDRFGLAGRALLMLAIFVALSLSLGAVANVAEYLGRIM